MSDRGRMVLIFGIVALIAGGAGFYFFKIHQPAEQLKAAQQEIIAWESHYKNARACLLGKTPGSSKTSEALAIREMTPDPWDRGKCTPAVRGLSRGLSDETGIDRVEAAWAEVDKAAQQAAMAFATHVSTTTSTLDEDPLPAALDRLDAARANLYAAAEMRPEEHVGTPLRSAEIVPILDGKDPVTELTVDALPSAHGLVLFGRTDNRQVQVVLATGAAPKVARVGSGSMRALPELAWGATPGSLTLRTKKEAVGEVTAGAMDAEGAIATPVKLPITVPFGGTTEATHLDADVQPGDQIGSVMLAAVTGALAESTIIYGGFQTLVVARAKGAAITPDPPIKIDIATASTDADGRVALVWSTLDKVHRALLLRKGGEDAFELPSSFVGAPCMTNDRIWLMSTGRDVLSFGGGKPLAQFAVGPYSGLQGCTADAAIARARDAPEEIEVCTDRCRKVPMPTGAPDASAVTTVGGKLRAIASHAGVLGVWSEDKPPVFYALPAQAKPVLSHEWPAMALSNGKVIDVLARSGKAFVVIRIPAS